MNVVTDERTCELSGTIASVIGKFSVDSLEFEKYMEDH